EASPRLRLPSGRELAQPHRSGPPTTPPRKQVRTTQTPTRRVAGWASWTLGASALAVLRRLAGLLEAVLLPLLGPRVTGQEAGLLQRRTVIGVDLHQRAGDRQAQRARLAADATAAEVAEDVEAVGLLDGLQRLADQLLVHLVREVLLERAAVELELAAAGNQTH